MRTVTVQLRAADFSRAMVAMREWLDRNGYEATSFKYDQHEAAVVVSADFTDEVAAEAFARRFDGYRQPSPHS